jgi:hypothetical protein
MKILNNSILRKHSPPLYKQLLNNKTNTTFMKHFFFLLVAITLTINSFGQLEKSTWLVGGSGSFYNYNGTYRSTSNNADTKVTNIDIKTSIGYFLIDKLSVGLRPSFSFSKGKVYQSGVQSGLISSNTQFLIGPFARYYFLEKEKQFNLLADISYLVGTNTSPLPPKTKGSLNEFSISGGAEIFFNSSVGFEFLVGYKKKYEDIKGATGYVDNKSGFQIGIGFQIHLIK